MFVEEGAGANPHQGAGGTARDCMDFVQRPGTPEEIRKYRKSANLAPGKRFQHHGIADDLKTMNLESKIFGEASELTRVTAADLLNHSKASELEKLQQIKAEKVYRARAKEPLGRAQDRGMGLPEKFTTGNQAFGIGTVSSLEPAKDIIFPEIKEEDVRAEVIYQKSHNNWPVGVQKSRGIDWERTGVDPTDVRFGKKGDTIAFNGVSKNVEAVLKNKDAGGPSYYKKNLDNYSGMSDNLGQSKNLGQQSGARPLDYVYGKPSATAIKAANNIPVWGADQVMKGMYTVEQQRPDIDLGKSITPGFRNIARETRAYGCPSIRTDLPKLARRSVADSQNYGDDVAAKDLVSPPAYSDLNIDPSTMVTPRSFDSLRSLFVKIGYEFPDDVFFVLSKLIETSPGSGTGTIADFRSVLNDFLQAKDSGCETEWLEARTQYI
jgi:EF-hand domain-containing family member B